MFPSTNDPEDIQIPPGGVMDLSQEDILEQALKRVERRQYFERLHPKEKGDVTIALAYLFRCYQAGKEGRRPSSALNDGQWKFVAQMVDRHRRFFTGGSAFDQFL